MIESWMRLTGAADRARAIAAGRDLLARYAESHRRYHNTKHLAEVLAIVDEFEDEADDADAVRLAAWFHDAVYVIGVASGGGDVGGTDTGTGEVVIGAAVSNEEASARLAEAVLPGLGVADTRIREAARLVRITLTHDPAPGDRNAEVLCDADLAILGAEPARYLEYAREVRAEYAAVPEDAFRHGRAEILSALLAAPKLFHTAVARERYEDRARANLAAEIAALRA